MKDFRDLKVWRKAHELALRAYEVSGTFPADERFGLTSQVRRSAGSIGANIAEGCGRGSDGELGRFLQIAMGSAAELEYHMLLARDLGFVSDANYDDIQEKLTEVKRMLASLIVKLRVDAQSRS